MTNSGKGCRGFLGCFTAVVVIAAALGAWIYFRAPGWWQQFDQGVAPWVEKKARAFAGKMVLRPLLTVIDESGLSGDEKETWNAFLDTTWEAAEFTASRVRFREEYVEATRRVVMTPAGLYYALQHILERDYRDTTLTDRQLDQGKTLVTQTMAGLLDGTYGVEELHPLQKELYSVMVGSRVAVKSAEGRWERDINLRNFFRALLALQRSPDHQGDGHPLQADEALRWELEILREEVNALQPTSVPEAG